MRDEIAPVCSVDGCERPTCGRGLCKAHHEYWRRTGNIGGQRSQRLRGTGTRSAQGYIVLQTKVDGRKRARQLHRVVMEEMLGRPLLRSETVHHRNGVPHDNRPENLELWASRHPRGQRVEDLVDFAIEILSDYRPGALA